MYHIVKFVKSIVGLGSVQKLVKFYGPPGTDKTLTAKVLSSIIGYPLVLVRFDSVISSYLGQTASNLRKIFDYIESGIKSIGWQTIHKLIYFLFPLSSGLHD